jgi:hypothetical protein
MPHHKVHAITVIRAGGALQSACDGPIHQWMVGRVCSVEGGGMNPSPYLLLTQINSKHTLSAWCLVPGAWCLVPGAWCLVPGAWCLVPGAHRLYRLCRLSTEVHGVLCVVWWLQRSVHSVPSVQLTLGSARCVVLSSFSSALLVREVVGRGAAQSSATQCSAGQCSAVHSGLAAAQECKTNLG